MKIQYEKGDIAFFHGTVGVIQAQRGNVLDVEFPSRPSFGITQMLFNDAVPHPETLKAAKPCPANQ